MDLNAELSRMGLSLPEAPKPVAAYVPAVLSGPMVYVSGQLPLVEGKLQRMGRVPSELSVAEAQEEARRCALNALAVLGDQIGSDWSRLVRLVRLGVYVACEPGFADQAKVANGASELLGKLLGEAGRHARAAVGVSALPLGAAVELELIAEVRPTAGA
jgi:enamine deaminase RidA (YjgF/YER057c/UK114 family)